jgi:RNA polymerase sigma-70 factor (ECF subfamily)
MTMKRPNAAATRKTLIERLQHQEDKGGWEQFYETYSQMIFDFALKGGLSAAEAEEVVQETVITVYKTMQQSAYYSGRGSFKAWLFKIVRCRVVDQIRNRTPDSPAWPGNLRRPSNKRTSTVERVPDPNGAELDEAWEAQWKANAIERAMVRVKKRVHAKQFQIFDLYVLQAWPMKRVTSALSCSITQVYLAKHRVGKVLKKEMDRLAEEGLAESADALTAVK